MKEFSFHNLGNINQENHIKNKIITYKFDNIFIYLLNIISHIYIFIKNRIWRREKREYYFFGDKFSKKSHNYCKKDCFDVKYDSTMLIENKNEIKKYNNKRKENRIKKRNNNIRNYNIIIRNYIIINLIIFTLINIFSHCNIFNTFFFHNSKITLKIQGTGEIDILGNGRFSKFENINYLKEVYINGIPQAIDYKYIFNKTENFVELIWDDNINNCKNMFSGCSQITEINLSNFNTSLVTSMDNMFGKCISLTSLDLSNFNTSQVIDMYGIFGGCWLLTSLDLSNFDTSKVEDMSLMFSSCRSLTSLDLSNFNTSKVKSMCYMFSSCSSLTSLNLSNFDTSEVTFIQSMFNGCSALEYINLNNFDATKLYYYNYDYMFSSVPENVVICIINENKIFTQINSTKKCPVFVCTNNWKSKQKKIINNTNECIESCDISLEYIYEYNGKCYENCLNGFLYDDNNNKMNKCKCELEKCLLCPNVALKNDLCIKCNTDFYPKENDILNLGEYINCYKEPEGYYLDNNIYKECYNSCKTCNISGNNKFHNCIECKENYTFTLNNKNFFNCYENCTYYHYFDDEYNYHCTSDLLCPNEYPIVNEEKMECIKIDIHNIKYLINKKNDTKIMTKNEEIEYYDNLIKLIEKTFTENYNTLNLDNGHDEYIKTEKMTVIFTTTANQKKNINNNLTTIDLGDCETLLKNDYNISINETLYMKILDIPQENMKTSKVAYDLYFKLFGENLIKLNLTACEKSKILIYIPFKITKNIDKYNISSGYYNDICYTTTSEDGADITIKDRRKKYMDGDKIVCQEDCEFSKYDSVNFKAMCSCHFKESSPSIINMKIDKLKLFKNFKNIKNFANFNFLVCYKKLLNKKGIINNIGR